MPPELIQIDLATDRGRTPEGLAGQLAVDVVFGELLPSLRQFIADHGCDMVDTGAALLSLLLFRHTRQLVFDLGVWTTNSVAAVRLTFADEVSLSDVAGQVSHARSGSPVVTDSDGVPKVCFADEGDLDPRAGGTHLCGSWVSVADDLILRLRFDASVLAAERVAEIGAQLRVLARQALASPDVAIADQSLVTEAGLALLPDPGAALDMPRHVPLTEAIFEWARRTPEALAIRHRGRGFSYAQLEEYSARIASELLARGICAGDTVAVAGARSFALIGAMLGVFRSGGVLLTLDPNLPIERRLTMLHQADARVMVRVSESGEASDLGDAVPHTILVDAGTARIQNASPAKTTALPSIDPAQPAYVFFTSGSTGIPKGVKGRHAGLAHFLAWQRQCFGVGPGDRASQLTALSFDVVLRDTFLALTSGALLCIPEERDVLDPARVLAWLEAEQITTVHVVPSLARMWLNHVPEGVTLPLLRRVFFAGEPLTDMLVRRWREAFRGDFEVVNLYGPTETTLAKCFHRVGDPPEPGVQPIGRTLPQTQALVLTSRRLQCGLHEVGEIAIRTPFRTLGYVGNPEANAKSFVVNPFRDQPDDLVYMTGDSGRYRGDGLLEILGRIDNQVKIRGVRIEPGEIESCLGHHPDVREAVVLGCDGADGEKILVAYVVPKSAATDRPLVNFVASCREFLRARLPDAMVPSAFVRLEALPLNANGKVDKKALPPPDRTAMAAGRYVEPRNEMEQALARIWQSVLRLDHIGIDDNFFDIGGHSLMAVQITSTIAAELGRACSLPTLFRAPTIRALSKALREGAEDGSAAAVLPLQPHGSAPALFCICGVYLYQELADRLAPDIPVYGIFLPVEQRWLDAQGMSERMPSVEEMAADYVAAMRSQQPHGPYCLAGVSFGGVLAYEMAQQLVSAGEEVAFLAILDSVLPTAFRRNWTGLIAAEWRKGGVVGLTRRSIDKLARTAGSWFASSAGGAVQGADEHELLGNVRDTIYKASARAYQPRPYAGEAMLVRAEDKSFFVGSIADPSYGWGGLVARLQIHDLSGDHLGILRAPHVDGLIERLRPAMTRATQLQSRPVTS